MEPIITISHLSKRYILKHLPGGYLSLRERILGGLQFSKRHEEEFWALKDVSFDIHPGESFGIIGRNGAGKSTLLKVLSKITPPTEGKIRMRGRVASLLEVGTGFHPELTGRENIFFNGSLLGMKKREIENKFSEIVDFSGVEQFLDTPLKHYSSGMQLRLAFSVAAFLEPEILVIDEVLAVGDAEFQKKCMGKMEDVSKSGRTILFVSHNLSAVENLCTRAVLLDKGQPMVVDSTRKVINAYQQSFSKVVEADWANSARHEGVVYLAEASASLSGSQPCHQLQIDFRISAQDAHPSAFIAFDITNSMGVTIAQAIPKLEPFVVYPSGPYQISTVVDLPPLIPDIYKISIWAGSHNTETLFWEKEILGFEITDSPTKGRNFPHSHSNGFVVPQSRIL